ncbi:hypothetical protein THAOC_21044 [Thalassiosira oceanica]|uniref:Uncharacterized protein n=1 Tax=Thalassiosira oceanica TaxID=159749 RepID=K0S1Y3_THAOC|nr:hypothetical protein THAOC_21044 [Thalassiosira oceanica]|eukprot:EJK58799.1 hypothetical protein THAOC_21044 [Thalassiosira oceanica]
MASVSANPPAGRDPRVLPLIYGHHALSCPRNSKKGPHNMIRDGTQCFLCPALREANYMLPGDEIETEKEGICPSNCNTSSPSTPPSHRASTHATSRAFLFLSGRLAPTSYRTNKTRLAEAPFRLVGDDNGPGSEPPPRNRIGIATAFVPSHRRSPSAPGKPSFPYFKADYLPRRREQF